MWHSWQLYASVSFAFVSCPNVVLCIAVSRAQDMDAASFIATLSPELREEVCLFLFVSQGASNYLCVSCCHDDSLVTFAMTHPHPQQQQQQQQLTCVVRTSHQMACAHARTDRVERWSDWPSGRGDRPTPECVWSPILFRSRCWVSGRLLARL